MLLALVVAPLLDVGLMALLETVANAFFESAIITRDACTLIAAVVTAVTLIGAYSYLRRPKVWETGTGG